MARSNLLWPTSGRSFVRLFRSDAKGLARGLRLLERRGRWGGVMLVGVAAALGVPGAFLLRSASPWNGEAAWSPAFTALGAVMLLCALVSVVPGVRALVAPIAVAPSMDKEAFLGFLRQHPKPVHVCLKCRIALPPSAQPRPECPKCLSARDCFHVTSDADVRVVVAALV
jgi:hypothetical protein